MSDHSCGIADDDRLGRLLQNRAQETLRSDGLFGPLLLGQIARDHRDHEHILIHLQRSQGEQAGQLRPVDPLQSELLTQARRARPLEQSRKARPLTLRQKAIQRYARDLTRLKAEIVCKQFSQESLQTMTNLQFPTMQEKQAAQMMLQAMEQVQQAQAAMMPPQPMMPMAPPQPPPVDPELQRMASQPSWEEIMQVMKSDQMRCYVIDVETDTTAAGDVEEDQKNVIELLGGITSYMTAIAPAVQMGVMPIDSAKTILLAAVRRFKMGDEVEDAIDQIGAAAAPPGVEQRVGQLEQLAAGALQSAPPAEAVPTPGQPMAPAAPVMIQ